MNVFASRLQDFVNESPLTSATLCSIVAAILLYEYVKKSRHFSSKIPGPRSTSLLAGNMLEMSTTGACTLPLEWRKKFHNNSVIRIHGPYFAGEGLLISDPSALWKIYDTNETFKRPPSMAAIGEKLVGKGIILSEGETHYRMKRIMQPAFNAGNVRNLLTHFRHGALALVDAWGDSVSHGSVEKGSNPSMIDVFDWLGFSALDMIGLAAFGVKLGAVSKRQGLEGSISDIAVAYESVLNAMGAEESAISIFIRYSPMWLINLLTFLPNKLMRAIDEAMTSATKAANIMILDRMEAIKNGDPLTNDVLTLMIKANIEESAKYRLTEAEMTAQITSILFAGHGTSAAFMSWALYHLAHDQKLQDTIREEILSHAVQYDAEQDANIFSSKTMPLFDAFLKEVMRFYPVVHFNEKMAVEDTVLKLSRPLVLNDGSRVQEIPCPKGTIVYADIVSYNFSKEIWGDDADQFRIERWLAPGVFEGKTAPSVYAGLFNFVAGPRACLGWRFLILEAQVMIFELVRHFRYYPNGPVAKRMQMAMVPAVMKGGKQVLGMPLYVERV